MKSLRAALVWAAIALLTVGFGLPAIFAAYLPPRGDWFLRFARGWARAVLAVAGVSVSAIGTERIARGGSYVVAANHESFADILVLLACLPLRVRFLAKRSIFRVPVLGWSIAAAGFIPVDRGRRERGSAVLERAAKRLAGGRSVVIFPEETRTRNGELLPFKKGAALLAARAGLPMLPVGLHGTRRVLPRGAFRMASGRVVLRAGEPLPPPPAGKAREATAALRAAIEGLRREAGA
jgi:1-acyl-sn-glycerol-3-phosphate acyltransferase